MTKALDIVAANPSIAPGELARKLGISNSYARTLIRRARTRVGEPETYPEQFEASQSMPAPAPDLSLQLAVTELSSRLEEAERGLSSLRSMPTHMRTSMNLNRRTEVLRLLETGLDSTAVANQLGIPAGEVEFILKMSRMMAAAV